MFKTRPSKTDAGVYLYSEEVNIQGLNLNDTGILMTVPIITSMQDPNMTFGCGFVKRDVNTFKEDGCMTFMTDATNATVTCLCDHATSFGV